MARKIFFSGAKGGSGKTTLAVHFCNFIFYYKKKSVALIGFDIQKELTFLGKEVLITNGRNYTVTGLAF